MNKRTQIILAVNEQAEKYYHRSQQLGELAAEVFLETAQETQTGKAATETQVKGKMNRHRAQMTGLENIAETTLKVSDILDYIKKQIARQKAWRKAHNGELFGESLKTFIEQNIKKDAIRIYVHLKDAEERDQQTIYLQLIRQSIRQIVVHYEYAISLKEQNQDDQ